MTNKEKWDKFTEGLSSPQNYIDWGWRLVVSAALQRRVCFGADPKNGHKPLFPNMYVVLVGKAGVGKGLVIGSATDLLKHWKKKDALVNLDNKTDDEKKLIASIQASNEEAAEKSQTKGSNFAEKTEPTLIPYAPDDTTYESLVETMVKSIRRVNITEIGSDGQSKLGVYGHSSVYFSLPELASLLRKRTEDVVNYLLGIYDCPLDYERKTKTQGEFRVRRGCLNILAGTTPTFMETVFTEELLDQGFSSRTFFIFAAKNRKNVCFIPPLTQEQLVCRKELLDHIRKLASLYGEIKIDEETTQWMQQWWEGFCENELTKANDSHKLGPFDARMNIHVQKLAAALHFSESLDLHVPLFRFQEAVEILMKERHNMRLALTFQGKNPVGKVTDQILEHLRVCKKDNLVNMTTKFWKDLPNGKKSLEEVLEYLIQSGQITDNAVVNDVTGKITINYLIAE
jgi:ABC-type dipeptide/oligopeptide/nickel transport system ATPase component